MADWSKPWPLAKVTADAGFTMSDVAFVSGLDESTVSRLWDDPKWLDRASGRTLQALMASVPGVAEYSAAHSLLTRRNKLVSQLEAEGLVVNRPALALSSRSEVPHQYLVNALDAALSIMRGDDRRVCSYLVRFWGLQQNSALESLYAIGDGKALLQDPEPLFAASLEMSPRLTRKSYSYHSIIAQATFAHHLGIAIGELDGSLMPPAKDRQSAFMMRSGMMGLLINSNDIDLAQRYEKMVAATPVLMMIEDWSFPTYTRDSKPNSDFALPGSILLRRTANEVLKEIDHYTDAYVYYLCRTYLPLALERDATFGLRLTDLEQALTRRAELCTDTTVRNACLDIATQIRENG